MWQPAGDKLSNVNRLGNLQPVLTLPDWQGHLIHTCKDPDDELLLAYQCAEEAGTRRYLVVPSSDQWVNQLTAGTLGIREALSQPRAWLADVDASGKVLSIWKADPNQIPAEIMPPAGSKLEAIPEATLAEAPPAAAPAAVPPRPAAAAPARPAPAAPKPAVAAPARPAAPAGPSSGGRSGGAAPSPARIMIERMMHRNAIAIPGETGASYMLLKLLPSVDASRAPALNLAFILDVSGSMYAEDGTGTSRLKRIQEATKLAISKLRPQDMITVGAFAYDAKILLPSTTIADKEKIDQTIDQIDQLGVDAGGTAMDEGIKIAMDEVAKHIAPGKLNQVVILTDGETTGETICKQLAKQADEKGIHLSLMGIGTDWNASLIKELATASAGKWYYIDVTDAGAAERVIVEEFESLAATGFLDVEIHVKAVKGVKIKGMRQVAPDIKQLELTEPEERHYQAYLGTLERDNASKYIVELILPKRPDGKYAIAQMEISFDPGTGQRQSQTAPIEVVFAAQHGFINAEVARHIDEVQLAEMNVQLQKAIAADKKEDVQKMAEMLVKKGGLMGKRADKKTMLAKQVLQEINAGGRVSKKTQLAMDDAARVAAED